MTKYICHFMTKYMTKYICHFMTKYMTKYICHFMSFPACFCFRFTTRTTPSTTFSSLHRQPPDKWLSRPPSDIRSNTSKLQPTTTSSTQPPHSLIMYIGSSLQLFIGSSIWMSTGSSIWMSAGSLIVLVVWLVLKQCLAYCYKLILYYFIQDSLILLNLVACIFTIHELHLYSRVYVIHAVIVVVMVTNRCCHGDSTWWILNMLHIRPAVKEMA